MVLFCDSETHSISKRNTSYSFKQVPKCTVSLLPLENKIVRGLAVLFLETTYGCCACI